MAQGVSGVQLLQGRRRSHDECSLSCSNELLHPTWPERVGPFNDSSDVAASRPSRPGQHLHPFQNSDYDTQLIHWRHWGAQGRLWDCPVSGNGIGVKRKTMRVTINT